MIIEIHKPELENLVRKRMVSGEFQNVEDALMQALKSSPAGEQPQAPPQKANSLWAAIYADVTGAKAKQIA